MGTASESARANENQTLLNYGFRFFESHKLFSGKQAINEARIWKGNEKNIQLGLAEDLFASIPSHTSNELKTSIQVNPQILAPVKAGDKLGLVTVSYKNEVITTKDLIALQNIEKGGIFRRLYDTIAMKF